MTPSITRTPRAENDAALPRHRCARRDSQCVAARHNRHRERPHRWIHYFDITSAFDILAAPPRLRPCPLIGLEEKRGGTALRPHLIENPSACLHTPRFENQGHVQTLPANTQTAPTRVRNGTEHAPQLGNAQRARAGVAVGRRLRQNKERGGSASELLEVLPRTRKEARRTQSRPRPSARGSLQLTVR